MFNNLTIPAGLTKEYVEDVIYTRYENRRPAYIFDDGDSYEIKRFLSEWNQILASKSLLFSTAYEEILKTPEFLDYKEKTVSSDIGNNESKNTGTNTTRNTGNTVITNNLQTKTNDNQENTVDNYNVNESYSVENTEGYLIDGPILNPVNRDISKSNGNVKTVDATVDNTGTVKNDLNTQTELELNTTVANNHKIDLTTDRSGYNKPIWEIVDSYIKQSDPWDILWDSLDDLFSTHYKVVF